jgi:hypothetical protein
MLNAFVSKIVRVMSPVISAAPYVVPGATSRRAVS